MTEPHDPTDFAGLTADETEQAYAWALDGDDVAPPDSDLRAAARQTPPRYTPGQSEQGYAGGEENQDSVD
jgi:hypothetical protein